MSKIKELKLDVNGLCLDGVFESYSLFKGEMKVSIFTAGGASEEDAERCIDHYNIILANELIITQIHEKLSSFFLYMYDEWRAMDDIYGEIADSLEEVMDAYKAGKPLTEFLSDPTLYVEPQPENELGYGIECECPWEPEHQCMILIRNNKVAYVGPSGVDVWDDDDDLFCIWNEV